MNEPDTNAGVAPAAPRTQLAQLLSRLAGLQGCAVPAYRFALVEATPEGVPLETLSLSEQARTMWRARFPQGDQRQLRPLELSQKDFPLLLVLEPAVASNAQASRSSDQATPTIGPGLLLRGRLSHGGAVGDDAGGQQLELSESQLAAAGCLLRLQVDDSERAPTERGPETAHDWFVHAARKHRRVFLEGIFASFIISTLALFSALYTMQVYDRVVPTRGYETLLVLTFGVLIAVALEFLMKQSRAHIVERASRRIDLELSGVFFGKAMDIRLDARPATVGTFAAQIRNYESVRQFMTTSTLFVLADAPFALLFIGVIALLAGPVALVPAVMVPLAVLSGFLATRRLKALMARHMEEANRKNGLLIESIDGAEAIKASGAGWKMEDRHQQLSAAMADNDVRMRLMSQRATHLTQTIQQMNYIGLIAFGAYAITQGQLTMGALIACSIIAGRALGPIAQIPQIISQWNQARIALEALDGIMAMPGERERGSRLVIPERCHGRLDLEQVKFSYREDQPSLDVDRLRLRAGERVAIVGAIGSGKSTLIKLLSGLYKPASGRLLLDDIDMQQLAPAYLREHVGYLPQDVRLFNGTLRDNLTLGLPTPSDSSIMRAAQLTGLDRVLANHPQGLEMTISEGGRGLSGGQRQLVGLTRLLLAQPRVLLLDEPTASMDGQSEGLVMRHLFEEIAPDSLLVVVTHKPSVLPLVDRIIVMDQGRVAMDDERDKVLALMRQGRAGAQTSARVQAG